MGKTITKVKMTTFLPPIEKPKGLMMKLAYYFTRRQFGKVITPLKVPAARLPSAFGLFYTKVANLDKSCYCRGRPPGLSVKGWRVSTGVISAWIPPAGRPSENR